MTECVVPHSHRRRRRRRCRRRRPGSWSPRRPLRRDRPSTTSDGGAGEKCSGARRSRAAGNFLRKTGGNLTRNSSETRVGRTTQTRPSSADSPSWGTQQLLAGTLPRVMGRLYAVLWLDRSKSETFQWLGELRKNRYPSLCRASNTRAVEHIHPGQSILPSLPKHQHRHLRRTCFHEPSIGAWGREDRSPPVIRSPPEEPGSRRIRGTLWTK